MNQKCKHNRTKQDQSSVRCYCGSVAVEPYTTPNPAAAGNITYIEQCLDCGMERAVNCNQRHEEYSPWGKSRAQLDAEESARQRKAREAAEDKAVQDRACQVESVDERDGYHTLVRLTIAGRRVDVLQYQIEEAARQIDNGDGLVPFYRGLLRAVRNWSPSR